MKSKNIYLFASAVFALIFAACEQKQEPPTPPTPPVPVDTITTNAYNVVDLRDWLNTLPAAQPNPIRQFHNLVVKNPIAIDGAGGNFVSGQFYTLRNLAGTHRANRRDLSINGLWGGRNYIKANDSIHLIPQDWIAELARMPIGGNNFWTTYAYWTQFGEYSGLLNLIDPPFRRVPRMTDYELLADDGTVRPDTLEITRNQENITPLWDALPRGPGQVYMILNNWSLGDMTLEQLSRLSTPALRDTDLCLAGADIRTSQDIAFRSVYANTLPENLMFFIIGMRNLPCDGTGNPFFNNKWGHSALGTVRTSSNLVPITPQQKPNATRYFTYHNNSFTTTRPPMAQEFWSQLTFVTLRSFGISNNPQHIDGEWTRYQINLTGANAIMFVVPDEFKERSNTLEWRIQLRQFIGWNTGANMNDNLPPLSNMAGLHFIFESQAADMGITPRDMPIYNPESGRHWAEMEKLR